MIEKWSLFLHLFNLVERMVNHKFDKNRSKVKVTKNAKSFFMKVGITVEPIIIETSDWHPNVSNSNFMSRYVGREAVLHLPYLNGFNFR